MINYNVASDLLEVLRQPPNNLDSKFKHNKKVYSHFLDRQSTATSPKIAFIPNGNLRLPQISTPTLNINFLDSRTSGSVTVKH